MRRRALIGTIATLGVVAVVGLFAALSLLLSSPSSAYAQGTNNAPTFTDGETATRSVNENTAAFSNIGNPVAATDSDSDDRLTYSIKNARKSPFTIVRATGQLQVGQPLDHEDDDEYTVVVQVTDSEDADGDFETNPTIDDTITVTVTVNDVEEPGKVSLSWTRPQPHTNSEVEATLTDPDGAASSVTWQWQTATTGGNWSNISGATSQTYTPAARDVTNRLQATASYTDPRGSSKTASSEAAYVKPVPNPNQTPDFRVNTSGGYTTGVQSLRQLSRMSWKRLGPRLLFVHYARRYIHWLQIHEDKSDYSHPSLATDPVPQFCDDIY